MCASTEDSANQLGVKISIEFYTLQSLLITDMMLFGRTVINLLFSGFVNNEKVDKLYLSIKLVQGPNTYLLLPK